MPRTSFEALTTPVVDVATVRLAARPELPGKARRVFAELVESVAPGHFCEADRPLIEALATAIVVAREAAAHVDEHGLMQDGKPNPAAKVLLENQKVIRSLMTTCRMSPQSRISKEKAGSTTGQERRPMVDFRRYARE